MSYTPTILVLDSGLGGLTVLREIVNVLPDARYVYVADDAFFPYGRLSEDEIIARVMPLVGELIGTHAPDIVVIACNTMSVSVLGPLRAAYSVPFVGTVPAIKPACAASKTKRVSVLGTRATVQREYTQALIRNHAQACTVTLVGAARLASLAEDALEVEGVAEHHGAGEDGGDGVGEVFAGDVRGAAVDGLVEWGGLGGSFKFRVSSFE